MARRKRLTARKIRESALDKTPFPGDINNELSQSDADHAGYAPYEQQPGWDLTQEGDPAVGDDDREENNLGKVRSAAFKAKCVKSTKLAALLLGEKVSDEVIEEQALDFLNLPAKSIDASLKRFMASDSLYRELQKKEAEEDDAEEEKEDEKEAAEEEVTEDKEEEKEEEKEDEKEAAEEDEKEEDDEETKEASDVVVDDISDLITSETKESEEIDIELSSEVVDESDALTSSEEKEIEQAFFDDKLIQAEEDEDDDDDDEEDGEEKEAKKAKLGAKKMGGQPRVASREAEELELLWGDFDAPTMKEIDSKLFG